jgi:hypothetical protein
METEKKTKGNRLMQKIQANMAGKSAGQVTVRATLTGPAAEVWRAIKSDAEGLSMDDQTLMVALLDAGATPLRKVLKAIPRG